MTTHASRRHIFFGILEKERAELDAKNKSKGARKRGQKTSRQRSTNWRNPAAVHDNDEVQYTPSSLDTAPWDDLPTISETPVVPDWSDLAALMRSEQHFPAELQNPATSDEINSSIAEQAPAPPERIRFMPKVESPDIRNRVTCPQCHAIIGMRCLGPLNEPRFASHGVRIAAYNKLQQH